MLVRVSTEDQVKFGGGQRKQVRAVVVILSVPKFKKSEVKNQKENFLFMFLILIQRNHDNSSTKKPACNLDVLSNCNSNIGGLHLFGKRKLLINIYALAHTRERRDPLSSLPL